MKLIPALDTIIATVMLISGSILGITQHEKLKERESSVQTLVHSINEGAKRYSILSDDKCVGFFTTTFEKGTDSWDSKLNGRLRIRSSSGDQIIGLEGQAFFNSLGQLGGSFIAVKSGKQRFVLGTTNINPITVRASYTEDTATMSKVVYIPGPIELRKNSDQSFRLSYEYFDLTRTKQVGQIAQPMFALLRLALKDSSEKSCSEDNLSALDAKPITDRALSILGSIQ